MTPGFGSDDFPMDPDYVVDYAWALLWTPGANLLSITLTISGYDYDLIRNMNWFCIWYYLWSCMHTGYTCIIMFMDVPEVTLQYKFCLAYCYLTMPYTGVSAHFGYAWITWFLPLMNTSFRDFTANRCFELRLPPDLADRNKQGSILINIC